jgi:hypothetical protein
LRLFLCADDGALKEIKLTMQNNACSEDLHFNLCRYMGEWSKFFREKPSGVHAGGLDYD